MAVDLLVSQIKQELGINGRSKRLDKAGLTQDIQLASSVSAAIRFFDTGHNAVKIDISLPRPSKNCSHCVKPRGLYYTSLTPEAKRLLKQGPKHYVIEPGGATLKHVSRDCYNDVVESMHKSAVCLNHCG